MLLCCFAVTERPDKATPVRPADHPSVRPRREATASHMHAIPGITSLASHPRAGVKHTAPAGYCYCCCIDI